MAKYCSKCNRKIGFFEEEYNGLCIECYYNKIQVEEKDKKIQEYKEAEEKKKIEIQKRIEEEKKAEQRKIEKIKEQEEKYKNFRIQYMSNARAIQLYINIVDMLNKYFPANIFVDEEKHYYCWADSLNLFIKGIISNLPMELTINDIEKNANSKFIFENIMKENEEDICFKITNYEDIAVKINNYIDKIKGTKEPIIYIDFEKNLFFSDIDMVDLEKQMQELKSEICKIQVKDRAEFVNLVNSMAEQKIITSPYKEKEVEINNINIYLYFNLFYWSLVYIYNVFFYDRYVKKFEKSELQTLFLNLEKNTDDSVYIADKIYELYLKLYINDFDIQLSKIQVYKIIQYELINCNYSFKKAKNIVNKKIKDNTLAKENCNLQEVFKEIINNEYILELLKNGIYTNWTISEILNKILKEKIISFNDIAKYDDTIKKIIEEKEENDSFIEAEKERDRILNGDFSKEIEMQKQEVEYNKVQNGYEFEEYVANLYKKLGYTIEEVTKKSGDQRSRCNCL